MQVSADRLAKAKVKMRGLAQDIRAFWTECANLQGYPVPGGQLEIHDLDMVLHALDQAVATIRTLDQELFRRSDETGYIQLRETDARGHAVRALTAPRNQAIHGSELVEPDVAQALGPLPPGNRYAILPRWRDTAHVPPSMFQGPRGKDQASYRTAYDAAAAGRPILDTLLDAFAFFERCDHRVVNRDGDNQIEGFPLIPLPLATRYRRLHPDWPSEQDWNETERRRILAAPPGGQRRLVYGLIPQVAEALVCGMTILDDGRKEAFIEPVTQVARDVQAGYRYIFEEPDRTELFNTCRERLAYGDAPDLTSLTDLTGDSRPWGDWYQLCIDDADYYRRQRQLPIAPGDAVRHSTV